MGKYTLSGLMDTLGVVKYPARWSEIFEAAMSEYDSADGCIYAQESLLYMLNEKYNAFPAHYGTLLEAARYVRDTEPVGRFVTLLGMALKQKETVASDLAAFELPDTHTYDHDMRQIGMSSSEQAGSRAAINAYTDVEVKTGTLPSLSAALAFLGVFPALYEDLSCRGVPEQVIFNTMLILDGSIGAYKKVYGKPGFNNLYLKWCRHLANRSLLNIGRLNFEIFYKFTGKICVFTGKSGHVMHDIALVDSLRLHKSGYALGSPGYTDEEGSYEGTLTRTETGWEGYPVTEDGRAADTRLELPDSKWDMRLKKGDPVINVHIPAQGSFAPDICEQAYRDAVEIIGRCYPEFSYKAFVCNSWLMDPQLACLLRPDSNIVAFQSRYKRFPSVSAGRGAIYFVFNKPRDFVDFTSLPENTSLERALKKHYSEGRYIYEPGGYFLPETIKNL